LHRRHHFTGGGPDHREAKDAVVVLTDESFHESLPLVGGLRPEYRVHGQPRDACDDVLAFRFAFAQPDTGKRGVSEHAIWNKPIARAAISSCQIVTYDTKIVFGYVRELWAAGAFPESPHVWRTRLQSAIHRDVAATV